jgi:hypothetical protein
MCMYVSFCNGVLTYYSCNVCIHVIYKCFSWGSNPQRDLGKPSQAINRKLLSVLSHVVSEEIQSALRTELGWIIRCGAANPGLLKYE